MSKDVNGDFGLSVSIHACIKKKGGGGERMETETQFEVRGCLRESRFFLSDSVRGMSLDD